MSTDQMDISQPTASPTESGNAVAASPKEDMPIERKAFDKLNTPLPVSVTDMMTELKEMDVFTKDVPLNKQNPEFRKRYLSVMEAIDQKKASLGGFIGVLETEGLLSKEHASEWRGLIDITDPADTRGKPAFGFVEATSEAYNRSIADSNIKFQRLEERNRALKEENGQMATDLENERKKRRVDDNISSHRMDEDRSTKSIPTPMKGDTHALIDMFRDTSQKPSGSKSLAVSGFAVQSFDYDIIDRLKTNERGAQSQNVLAGFLNQRFSRATGR